MEQDNALSSPEAGERSRAFGRLVELAKNGNQPAAQRIEAFETRYDQVKESVAKSAWWAKGQGAQPAEAPRWMADGKMLAEYGDRPAMLDVAFATGYGRSVVADRAAAAETYIKVLDRSTGIDDASKRVQLSASRGLSAMLNAIVSQKDEYAAQRLHPALEARALAGAAYVQYYLGLMSECVSQPPDLEAARQWYLKASADPVWQAAAERKLQSLGRWCPRRTG